MVENEQDLDTSHWLKDGRDTVGLLKCATCIEFEGRMQVRIFNFCSTLIDGIPNLRTTNFQEACVQ